MLHWTFKMPTVQTVARSLWSSLKFFSGLLTVKGIITFLDTKAIISQNHMRFIPLSLYTSSFVIRQNFGSLLPLPTPNSLHCYCPGSALYFQVNCIGPFNSSCYITILLSPVFLRSLARMINDHVMLTKSFFPNYTPLYLCIL